MSDIYGSHFEYSGISSNDYGLIIGNVETSRQVMLSGSKSGVTIFSRSAKKRYLIDDDYSGSPISFEVEIITEDGQCLELAKRRDIEKWLFNHRDYRKLYIEDGKEGETYEYVDGKKLRNYLNCRLINPEKLEYNGGIVGYKATLEADSNMYWQDETIKEFTVNNESEDTITNITVNVNTDLEEYIYPKVSITIGNSGGNIIIANNTDSSERQTQFIEIGAESTIIMNGELNFINEEYYEKFKHRNFIRLLDGENNLTIQGNVKSIKFEYCARRMM